MGILIALVLLMLTAYGVTLALNTRIERALPLSMLLIMSTMYFFSLFSVMGLALLVILYIVVIGFTAFVAYKRRQTVFGHTVSKVCTGGLLIFLFYAVAMFFYTRNMQVFQWDDFSHWTTTVKDMRFNDVLSVFPESVTIFKSYPPMMALWEYLFSNYSLSYRDSTVIYAYNMFCIILMIPITSKLGKGIEKIVRGILITCILFMIPYFMYSPYSVAAWKCTYIDMALTISFCFGLYVCFSEQYRENSFEKVINISLIIFILPLIKTTGKLMAALLFIAFVCDCYHDRRVNIKQLVTVIIAFLLSFSWNIYIKIMKIIIAFNLDDKNIVEEIINLFNGSADEWKYKAIENFLGEIGKDSSLINGFIDISYVAWIFVWIVMLLAITNIVKEKSKDEINRYKIAGIVIVVGYVIYQLFILGTFIFMFPEIEGVSLASYQRYAADYYIGATAFLIFILWEESESSKRSVVYAIILFLFCANIASMDQIFTDVFEQEESLEDGYKATGFQNIKNIEAEYEDYIQPSDKIAIFTESGSILVHAFKKIFIPAKTYVYDTNTICNQYVSLSDFIEKEEYNKVFFFVTNIDSPIYNWSGITEDVELVNGMYEVQRIDGKFTLVSVN